MFTALGAFLSSIMTSAQTALVPSLIAIGYLISGATWLWNHQRGKEGFVATSIGGAIMLLAVTLATALRGSLGATG